MKIKNNIVTFKHNRKDIMEAIFTPILIFAATFGFIVGMSLFATNYSKVMLDDPKANRIATLVSTYADDYTKALELDDVEIVKGEDIVVTVKTENYKNVTTFDVNGKLVESKTDVILDGTAIFVSLICGIMIGGLAFLVFYIPYGLVSNKLDEKDKKEKELERLMNGYLRTIENAKRYPHTYGDQLEKAEEEYAKFLEENGLTGIENKLKEDDIF